MNRLTAYILLILLTTGLALAAACSDTPADPEPDPEPEPENTPMEVSADIPGEYRWDEPARHSFSAADEDGFSEGFVRFYVQKESGEPELVWEKDFSSFSAASWDTTWTPSPFSDDAPLGSRGESWLTYELTDDFPGEQQTRSGEYSSAILPSRFTPVSGVVRDVFSGESLEGVSVTIKGHRSVESDSDGRFSFGREHEVDANSLAGGLYEALLEKEGYASRGLTLSLADDGLLEDVTKTPLGADSSDGSVWSYNTYLDHLYEDRTSGALRSNRWADGEVVDVLMYDESYFKVCEDNTAFCRVSSDDPNLIASEKYLNNSEVAYSRLDEVIPNITLNIVYESESDEPFPEKYGDQESAIYVAGSSDAPYVITQAHTARSDGTLTRALAFQRTDPPASTTVAGALADGIENMSLSTTGQESLTVNLTAREITSFGLDALHLLYSRDPLSGKYPVSIDRADGTTTSTVLDYSPPPPE
ncbi:MAG: carboxypeptidase regulatory-like domain-containing protein [Balneolaceae bacterium]|nr:carboxypeptidase regulatory-like domain-containing protein [Balneolaceae bacterium]